MQRLVLITAVSASVIGQIVLAPMAQAGRFSDLFGNDDFVSSGDYRDCASDLLEAGVAPAKAADVCAAAFDPEELADCATDIAGDTALTADVALNGCLRVRRPDELADCVVDVDQAFGGIAPDALSYCTRSLLPERFADCVTGLSTSLEAAAPTPVLEACVKGDYTATELFIPGLTTTEIIERDVTMPEVDLEQLEQTMQPGETSEVRVGGEIRDRAWFHGTRYVRDRVVVNTPE